LTNIWGMGDATVRLPRPTISRPSRASNRGCPRGARPLPVPPPGAPRRVVRPATLGPPPRIDQKSRPFVAGPPSFAQAAAFPGSSGSHTSVDGLVRLAKAFPELPTARLQAMQSQQSPSRPGQKKAKVTIHGPSRRKVLLTSVC